MTDKLKQVVKDEMTRLPKEMQEAMSLLDWGNVAEEIGKKYLLNESEINDLQVETLLILIGLEEGNSYVKNVENNVGTSKEEAEKIVEEVNQKIFAPIYNLLEANLKKNLTNKKVGLEQNTEFILSGGNYGAFLGKADETSTPAPETTKPLGTSNILDLKNKLIE
jgi:hypothetical protein